MATEKNYEEYIAELETKLADAVRERDEARTDSDKIAEDLGREIERGDELFDIAYSALHGTDAITAWAMGFE